MATTPVFLPGEIHGQRSLAGYSPWGHKESDMTKWLTLSLHFRNKKKHPSTDESRICGFIYLYTHTSTHTHKEYYSAIKKKPCLYAATWMNLEGITLKEINHSQKNKYFKKRINIA